MVVEANRKKFGYLKPELAVKHALDKLSQIEVANQFRDDLVLDEDRKEYKKTSSKYYNVWSILMDVIGEMPLIADFLVSEKPKLQTFKPVSRLPTLKKSYVDKNAATVEAIPELPFPPVHKPEAGIYVMNTQHISELTSKEWADGSWEPPLNHLEHVVNLKVKTPALGAGFNTISFGTRQYYDESLRISKDPAGMNTSEINPIYKFLPRRIDEPEHIPKTMTLKIVDEDRMCGSNLSLVLEAYLGWLTDAHRRDPKLQQSWENRQLWLLSRRFEPFYGSTVPRKDGQASES